MTTSDPIRARLDEPLHGYASRWPSEIHTLRAALAAVLDVHDPDEVGMCNGCWWESKDVDNQTPMADCEVRKAIATALGVAMYYADTTEHCAKCGHDHILSRPCLEELLAGTEFELAAGEPHPYRPRRGRGPACGCGKPKNDPDHIQNEPHLFVASAAGSRLAGRAGQVEQGGGRAAMSEQRICTCRDCGGDYLVPVHADCPARDPDDPVLIVPGDAGLRGRFLDTWTDRPRFAAAGCEHGNISHEGHEYDHMIGDGSRTCLDCSTEDELVPWTYCQPCADIATALGVDAP